VKYLAIRQSFEDVSDAMQMAGKHLGGRSHQPAKAARGVGGDPVEGL
jgi:hypothetical protein